MDDNLLVSGGCDWSAVDELHVKCNICGKLFNKYSNVIRHIGSVHKKNEIICEVCGRKFFRKDSLKKHIRLHEKKVNNHIKNPFKCQLCNEYHTREGILNHYEKDHNISIKSFEKRFDSKKEFEEWKDEFENSKVSRYIKHCFYKRIDGSSVGFYCCHRSGSFVSKGKGMRRIKTLGSNKINGWCPSEMKVTGHVDGKVTVFITETHVGHGTEIDRLTFKRRIYKKGNEIICKSSQSVVTSDMLSDNCKDKNDGSLESLNLLMKDIGNIEYLFSLKDQVAQDSFSVVESWLKKMEREGESNMVKFYKCEGQVSYNYPQLSSDDYFLIIITRAQVELLKNFGSDIVFVDGCCGIKHSKFELVTLMIVDELHQGFPCAFLFTNRIDGSAIEVFYSVVKQAVGFELKPNVFISDMTETFYNPWCFIMGPAEIRMYSSWNVDRTWRENLIKIKEKEKRADTYKSLKSMLEERDEGTFKMMLDNFLVNLLVDPDTKEFGLFFTTYYSDTPEEWAFCCHSHVNLDAITHLERVHRAIRRRFEKNFNKCLRAAMRFLRCKLHKRLNSLTNGNDLPKIINIRKKHRKAVYDKLLTVKIDDKWCVSNKKNTYEVIPSNIDCSCEISCDVCKFCVHSFQCSCNDYKYTSNMCVHVHSVGIEIYKKSKEDATLLRSSLDENLVVVVLTDEGQGGGSIVFDQSQDNDNSIPDNFDDNVLIEVSTQFEQTNSPIDQLEDGLDGETRLDKETRLEEVQKCFKRIIDQVSTEEQMTALEEVIFPLEGVMEILRNPLQNFNPEETVLESKRKVESQLSFPSAKRNKVEFC